jgi:hypothetical protein
MPSSAGNTVKELLRAIDAQKWQHVVTLIADGAVTRNSRGRIYIGPTGIEDWRRDTDAVGATRHFDATEVRDLGGGYVLVVGTEQHDPLRGMSEAFPGAWIYHVRNGLVTACLYFRTEREAVNSLHGPGRGERVVEIVERCVSAFNRDDFDALIAELDEELRFRPVLVGDQVIEGIDHFIEALVKVRVQYDDVLIEDLQVDEIAPDCGIATTTIRAADEVDVVRRRLAHVVRTHKGRVAEWFPFERIEAARTAISAGPSVAAVKHQPR